MRSANPIEVNQSSPFSNQQIEHLTVTLAILNASAQRILAKELTRDHFTDPRAQIIFAAICSLREKNEGISRISVKKWIEAAGRSVEMGYLAGIELDVADYLIDNFKGYVKMLQDCYTRRLSCEAMGDAYKQLSKGEGETDKVISRVVDRLRGFNQVRIADNRHWADRAIAREDEMDARMKKAGVPRWPWNELTDVVGPLAGGQYWILAGLSGHGKTTLLVQLLDYLAQIGTKCTLFSLEMDVQRVGEKLNFLRTGIDPKFMSDANYHKWLRGYESFKNQSLTIHDDGIFQEWRHLRIGIEEEAAKGSKVIAIDYVGLVDVEGYKPSEFALQKKYLGKQLKQLSRSLNIDIIGVDQINKTVGSGRRRPRMTDLEYGGEKDADAIMICNRPDKYLNKDEFKNEGDYRKLVPWDDFMELCIDKNRNGRDTAVLRYTFNAKENRLYHESSFKGYHKE